MEQGLPSESDDVARVHTRRIAMLSAAQDRASRAHIGQTPLAFESNLDELRQLAATKNQKIPFWGQFWLIFANYTRLFFTDFRGVVIKSIMFWLIFALVIIVFVKTPSAEEHPVNSIQNYAGLLFMIGTNMFMSGNAAAATVILPTKPLFKKDTQSRLYSAFAYFSAISAHIIPFYLINITAISFPFFFIFRLNFDPTTNLAWFWAFMVASNLCGQSVGLVGAAIAEKFNDLGAFMPLLFLPMMVTSGFFANVLTITWPLRVYSYIAPFRFVFQGLILNHFHDARPYLDNCKVTTPCMYNLKENCVYRPPPGTTFSQQCDPFVRFNFEQKSVWLNFVIVIVLFVGWRLIAFVIFLVRYRERDGKYSSDQELQGLYGGRLVQDRPVEYEDIEQEKARNYMDTANQETPFRGQPVYDPYDFGTPFSPAKPDGMFDPKPNDHTPPEYQYLQTEERPRGNI